ncbi:MAG: hypothetical protein NTW85_01735 [Methylococcales bacterium]|nr:hypothetical protein [Methylococcales bacterium]
MKAKFSPCFKPLILVTALAMTANVHGAETTDKVSVKKPWAFDLTAYLWLPSIDGNFSTDRFETSTSPSFIDIAGQMRNFPMAFNGHFNAHYERLGFYLDGNYMGMDFRPQVNKGESKGVSTRMGIMEYGASYRLLGQTASERVSNWSENPRSYSFDIYAGARTIWLGNKAEFARLSVSSDKSVTAPVLGGRVMVDISPKWYVLVDGSVGGFGVDKVNFTSSALGTIGYRTHLFDVPTSVEAGYKALSVKVNRPDLTSDITMHGPYVGLTGYW